MCRSCRGDSSEESSCYPGPCPEWGSWSEWSGCSKTCGGGGSRSRSRECSDNSDSNNKSNGNNRRNSSSNNNDNGSASSNSNPCGFGEGTQRESCGDAGCPRPTWAEWGEWSGCSRTCGGGQRRRWRRCDVVLPPRQSVGFRYEYCVVFQKQKNRLNSPILKISNGNFQYYCAYLYYTKLFKTMKVSMIIFFLN